MREGREGWRGEEGQGERSGCVRKESNNGVSNAG